MDLEAALAEVLLGASIRDLYAQRLRAALGAADERSFERAWRGLPGAERRRLEAEALHFAGELCRLLAERHAGDPRIAGVLKVWAERTKDYAAFDALLCHFRFPGRERLLEEGRRLFPGTLTRHWED